MGDFPGKKAATGTAKATNSQAATDTSRSVGGSSAPDEASTSGGTNSTASNEIAHFQQHIEWLKRPLAIENGQFSNDDERIRHHRAIIKYYNGTETEPTFKDQMAVTSICDLVAHLIMCTAVGAEHYEALKKTIDNIVGSGDATEYAMPDVTKVDTPYKTPGWCCTSKEAEIVTNQLKTWANTRDGTGFAQVKFNPRNDWHTFVLERKKDGQLIIHQGYQMTYPLMSTTANIDEISHAIEAGFGGNCTLEQEYLWLPNWIKKIKDKDRPTNNLTISRIGVLMFDRVDSSTWDSNRAALNTLQLVSPGKDMPNTGQVTPYFAV